MRCSTRDKIISVSLLFSLTLAIGIFYAGFHSIDTAWNMKQLLISTQKEYADITVTGVIISADEAYRNGLSEILIGLALSNLCILCFAYFTHRHSKCKDYRCDH